MDLETTLSTITESLPQEIVNAIDRAAAYFPEDLSRVIRHASVYLPKEIDFITAAQFLLYFSAAALILGVLGRIALGQRSSLNRSLSVVMGILFVYAGTIVIYTFRHWNLDILLTPLPFITLSEDYLIVLPITDTQVPALCSEVLALIILAFLVNLMDILLPQGKTIVGWYVMRFLSVIASIVLHLMVRWAFQTYLPEILVTYAPLILLCLLAFMLLSGVVNLIFSLLIIMTNPFMGAMYTFFFSSVVGKQMTKAVFSSLVVCLVFYVLDLFGYTIISITAAALMAYIPLALVLLLLWYLIGHVL